MSNEELRFYPKHPSGTKTHKIETSAMPILEQDAPYEVKVLVDEFDKDTDTFLAKYVDKRFQVTGFAVTVGPDVHNKPSIEISDKPGGETYALVIFPTDDHYNKIAVGDKVTVRANYLVMSNLFGIIMKYSELVSDEISESISSENGEKTVLNHPLFDGEKVIENASVVIRNGVVFAVAESDNTDSNHLLMPGIIDAHTHISTEEQIEKMLKNGVTATCDVSAPASLIQNSNQVTIFPSAGMTMGTLRGKSYVKRAIEDGAKYIKVLLMEPNLMLKSVLKDICKTAHENGIKVAVHAVSVKTVKMAVDSDADILLHVPMKEEFPEELAKTIAEKGIAVVPTLVMMEAFANSAQNGYKPADYKNAESAVKLLHECGVEILAGTDANIGSYAPAVAYGTSMHREMLLLVQTGLTPVEVLAGATSKVAKAFGIADIGAVTKGKKAVLLLIEGRPDKKITDSVKIKQIWVGGKLILGGNI